MSDTRPAPEAHGALAVLIRITKIIGEGRSLEEIFDAVADELAPLLPYDRCSVALIDAGGDSVSVSSHRGRINAPYVHGRRPLAGSLAGWILEHGRPLIHDVGPEDRFIDDDIRRSVGVARVVAVPLIVDGRPVGTFGLSTVDREAIGEGDVWLLETIGDHLALAVAATNLRRDAEWRAERAQFLTATAAAFASSLDFEMTLREAVDRAADVLGDLNAIFLRDEETDTLRLRELSHPDPAREALMLREDRARQLAADPLIQERVLSGEPLLVPRLTTEQVSPLARPVIEDLGVRSLLAVPLVAGGRTTGVLCSCWTDWPGRPEVRRREPESDDLDLARELAAQIAGAIENARLFAAAQRAVADRDAFLSVAAHELRTPLTTLRGRTQLFSRRLERQIEPADRASLQVILRQIDRLSRMVNDLLDLSRIDAGRLLLSPEPTDLVALAREAAAEHASPNDRIEVVAEEPVLVGYWDPWRLEQVLANLLGNALRYSPAGSQITIRVARSGDDALLSVADQGMGLDADELERIFERFYRGGQAERAGFGLGLAICRQIVADHGGRLWATSPGRGRGATFTMELPLARNALTPS